uniref:Uncharacterized protein n=1 Tax=Aegilops tauschii subsp. strangulata TaxID=200361 RepID=A0A453SP86_AEGTS
MGVDSIQTWKLLDDENLLKIDEQVLWRHGGDDPYQCLLVS